VEKICKKIQIGSFPYIGEARWNLDAIRVSAPKVLGIHGTESDEDGLISERRLRGREETMTDLRLGNLIEQPQDKLIVLH